MKKFPVYRIKWKWWLFKKRMARHLPFVTRRWHEADMIKLRAIIETDNTREHEVLQALIAPFLNTELRKTGWGGIQ
jgi:hypothetical protein